MGSRRPARRCPSGKVRYRNKVDALIALSRLQYQDKPGHDEQRAYWCRDCKGWHLTSQPLRGKLSS